MTIKNTLIKSSMIFFSSLIFSVSALAGSGQIILVNADSPGEGLNDPTSGAARIAAFDKAIEILNARLDLVVDIQVRAEFNPLSCSANSAVLGSAGANGVQGFGSNVGSIQANTWYPVGLFNELQGAEQNNASPYGAHEINAQFNSNIGTTNCLENGGWDYSFAEPAVNKTSFLSVVLHEIVHGLGFSSSIGSDGSIPSNFFGIYDRNLKHNSTDITALNQSQRHTAIRSDDLYWSGTSVNTEIPGTAEMYAPSIYEPGSSVSHFAKVTTPDELMEPVYTSYMETIGLASNLLVDLGWTLQAPAAPPANNAPSFTSSNNISTLYSDALSHTLTASDGDSDPLTFTLVSSTNTELTVNLSASNLTITPTNSFTGQSDIVVNVSDGTDNINQTLTVEVLPNFKLVLDSTNYADGAVITTGLSTTGFTLSGGKNNLTTSVDFAGADHSSLLTKVGNNYSLNMPTSGAFAGSYDITITDTLGNTASFTIKRPVRLISSHSQLIEASDDQYLYIEGANAGDLVDVVVSSGGSYLDVKNNSDQNISQATIANSSSTFNRTAVKLAAKNISQNESVSIQVDNAQLPTAPPRP